MEENYSKEGDENPSLGKICILALFRERADSNSHVPSSENDKS